MKLFHPLVSCFLLACSPVVCAQQVTYTPNGLSTLSQASGDPSIWNITVNSGAIQPGTYDAFCFSVDHPGYSEADYGRSFESTVTFLDDIIHNHANPGINMAGAMVNYAFDMYYGFWNQPGLDSDEVRERIVSFHHILWEIQRDYDPSSGMSSFDFMTGGHTVASNSTLNLIYGNLSSAYAGLSPSYISSTYDLKVIDGSNVTKEGVPLGGSIQPLIVVSVIPEPSSIMMGGLAASILMLRRRRVQPGV